MNLNNNEQEIPEVQLEEYAWKLDAKDFACRSKAKAKPQRREPAGSHQEQFLVGKELGPMLNHKIIRPSIIQSKQLITLLRHGNLPREDDGAIEF